MTHGLVMFVLGVLVGIALTLWALIFFRESNDEMRAKWRNGQ